MLEVMENKYIVIVQPEVLSEILTKVNNIEKR